MTATEDYVGRLAKLRPGELGLLRTHAGHGLDESVDGFDLFTGLWWPLRKESPRAPRREVAWLVAKLCASCPTAQSARDTLARQLPHCRPSQVPEDRFRQRFDDLLLSPLARIEPALRWAIGLVGANGLKLDWVQLTDDLSLWERESTRLKWAEEFLGADERIQSC